MGRATFVPWLLYFYIGRYERALYEYEQNIQKTAINRIVRSSKIISPARGFYVIVPSA